MKRGQCKNYERLEQISRETDRITATKYQVQASKDLCSFLRGVNMYQQKSF